MNANRLRALVAEGLIVAALLGAAHMLIAEPAAVRARQAEASLHGMLATIDEAAGLDLEESENARASIEWIRQMSGQSGDAARLYQTITALGERCGVQIDRVQPTPMVIDGRTGRGVTGLGCSIVAAGTYESIARFLDALQTDAGFSSASSLRLAPVVVDNQPLVQASIETTHRALDLEAMAGAMAEAQVEDEE